MKKASLFIFAAFFAAFVFSVNPAYAAVKCDETPLDKVWDWGTTLGKSGLEKDKVLMQNKAERAQRCAEKIAKQAKKDADKAAGDMKKKLGM